MAKQLGEAQSLLKKKEFEMTTFEQKSHEMLRQAQIDAEDCIKYFKKLAMGHHK